MYMPIVSLHTYIIVHSHEFNVAIVFIDSPFDSDSGIYNNSTDCSSYSGMQYRLLNLLRHTVQIAHLGIQYRLLNLLR